MTPESQAYLEKSKELLAEADSLLSHGFNNAAGRDAYLAGFHAAQALISEKVGKPARTHMGVHSEAHRLLSADPNIDQDLLKFLSRAYNLKAVADYETGPQAVIPMDRLNDAIELAKRFVVAIEQRLA